MNLTRRQWSNGWVPDQDPTNGDPSGLIRMDNLQQDEYGVLGLVRPIKQISSGGFSGFIDQIYAKIIGNQEILWVSIGSASGQIIRTNAGNFSDATTIGGGNGRTSFGDALGQVLITAGATRLKDSGTGQAKQLGLQFPHTPTVSSVSQPVMPLTGTFGLNEGHGQSGGKIELAFNTLEGILLLQLGGNTNTVDLGGAGAATDPSNDLIQFKCTPDDTTTITSIRLDVCLNGDLTKILDSYSFTWTNDDLTPGQVQSSLLSAHRGDFTRNGSDDPTFDWTHVIGLAWTINATAQQSVLVSEVKVVGGSQGQLNGVYRYIQVNVNNTGTYLAKSPCSDPTDPVTVINGHTSVALTSNESQVNEIWLFRISVADNQLGLPSNLDKYYRVATATGGGGSVSDTLSDDDAIRINITLNQFLVSLQPLDKGKGVTDEIVGMEGLYNERMIYITNKSILLSDRLNPDAIDSRYTIQAFGDPTEGNLWIRKLTNNVLLLGTSKDLYEISGTLLDLPNGTVDVNVIKIGEKYPPLNNYACNITGGGIAYLAADGIRVTGGTNTQLISPEVRLLFQGMSRAGFAPVLITPSATAYRIAAGKTKLLVSLPFQDGTVQLLIYDFISKKWRLQITDPVSIFVTQTDRILLGYYNSVNNTLTGQLFEMDVAISGQGGSGFLGTDGNTIIGFQVVFQTIYDANEQPRNRKDTFTLKVVCDTGGRDCSVYIGKDGGAFSYVGNINQNGQGTSYFPLNNITLGFRYAVKIVDVLYLTIFKLYEVTIEYDPRPEQLDYLRIQPSNLGTISRKRFINYAFVIDTLGNNINFQPLIDNALADTGSTVNEPVKETFIHYFKKEQIGTDISGILSGGVFEFYSLNEQEIISEKLPVPAKFMIIPNNDYGVPNRKRHSSYKFQINTRGGNVVFTPRLDGVNFTPATYNTTEKRVVEYFFLSDTIAREIGGTLDSTLADIPFEYYGVIVPQLIEKLPDRLEYYRIPNNNYGVAARKRVRTMPMVLDTYGHDVVFQPIVDGVPNTNTSTFNTTGKITVYHYFTQDSFGTDYAGQLTGTSPFEFYQLEQPEEVEVLPVPKKYDQLGPVRFDKIGKIFALRLRLIMGGSTTNLPFILLGDNDVSIPNYSNTNLYSGNIPVVPLTDDVYEYQFPKSINTDMLRIILGPTTDAFHRYDLSIRVAKSGMETDATWQRVR